MPDLVPVLYTRKVTPIEAIQVPELFNESYCVRIAEWCDGTLTRADDKHNFWIAVDFQGDTLRAGPGSYILRDPTSEKFSVWNRTDFQTHFEAVPTEE